jgi:DeoR/GlpR family transcriptional regulator of sugar metabolism
MQAHANYLNIELEVVDAAQHLKDEVALRKRGIAQIAAEQVQAGDVILIDGGQITIFLAEELAKKEDITVITNSVPVFDLLRDSPNITVISTGGVLRPSSGTLIGPTAEAALRELRADKLFLAVAGISLDFGLSHTNLAEVAMKQAMIRAAREVILLADHTKFGHESVVQVAPANAVNKLITDNALPASTRLDFTKLGIEVITAKA